MSEPRELTDPRQLRALAHPTRLRLLTEIGLRGTLTASEAAEIVGGTPAAIAYHLRALGKHGFVEEAPGADARQRPWRLTQAGFSWQESADDPAERAVASALGTVVRAEWLRNVQNFWANVERYPAEVRAVSVAGEFVLFATPAEIADVQRKIADALEPYRPRITDPALRPDGFPPFEVVVFAHPLTPPES